jgi:signal transduction histidine kinase
VSHELRTPLTSISASLALLMASVADTLPDPAARLLRISCANSQRLVRLVNDILDIEKLESGQVIFNFRQVDVRTVVDEVIDANRAAAEACGVRIRLLEDTRVCGDARTDPDRLYQVVTNLLSNAVKFSPRNGEVVVAVANWTGSVRISVSDHGTGIQTEFKPRIFERFAQANDTETRLRSGTGLGLSIVKQIVDRLGGKVSFADVPSGGTVFHVDLPCWERRANVAVGAI